MIVRDENIIHYNLARNRSSERKLTLDFGCTEPVHAFLKDKTADDTVTVFRPDHKHVGNGSVRNPHFGTGQSVATRDRLGTSSQVTRI